MTDNIPTGAPDQRPALELSVNPSGRVRVAVEYDPSRDRLISSELDALCRQASSLVTAGAGAGPSASQERNAARDQELAQRRRLNSQIGRLASRSIRKNRANLPSQREVNQALKEFGEQYGMTAETIGFLVRSHNNERDKRYQRLRARLVAGLFAAGQTYEQIGRRFSVSSKTAAKWTKDAVADIGNRDREPTSGPGNQHRKAG